MGRRVVLAALVAALAVAAPDAGSQPPDALQRYLASMSWPIRASVLRAHALSGAISCTQLTGDPPCWREVAANCRSLRSVEERGHLLQVEPPSPLRAWHAALARAYVALRDGCLAARRTALAVAAALEAGRSEPAGRVALRRFALARIDTFAAAATGWRAAVLRQATTAGVRATWLAELAP